MRRRATLRGRQSHMRNLPGGARADLAPLVPRMRKTVPLGIHPLLFPGPPLRRVPQMAAGFRWGPRPGPLRWRPSRSGSSDQIPRLHLPCRRAGGRTQPAGPAGISRRRRCGRRIDNVRSHRPETWKERGFDQARLLAQSTAGRLGVAFAPTLERRAPSAPQTRLTAKRRRKNLRGVFSSLNPPASEGKRVILIDDVLTTGSTASACARELKIAGALSVSVLTICHTVIKGIQNLIFYLC